MMDQNQNPFELKQDPAAPVAEKPAVPTAPTAPPLPTAPAQPAVPAAPAQPVQPNPFMTAQPKPAAPTVPTVPTVPTAPTAPTAQPAAPAAPAQPNPFMTVQPKPTAPTAPVQPPRPATGGSYIPPVTPSERQNTTIPSYVPNVPQDFDAESPMSIGDWIITMLVMMVPCVNIVMMFVWAFGSGNRSRANFFKAYLILGAICLALSVILAIAMAAMGVSVVDKMADPSNWR